MLYFIELIMEKEHIGELEELILLLIMMLKEDAYGLAIRNALKEEANRNVTIGAVHGTVNRLESKGLITSQLGGATELRGGRRKRVFTVTSSGRSILQRSKDVKTHLWSKIPELSI